MIKTTAPLYSTLTYLKADVDDDEEKWPII